MVFFFHLHSERYIPATWECKCSSKKYMMKNTDLSLNRYRKYILFFYKKITTAKIIIIIIKVDVFLWFFWRARRFFAINVTTYYINYNPRKIMYLRRTVTIRIFVSLFFSIVHHTFTELSTHVRFTNDYYITYFYEWKNSR